MGIVVKSVVATTPAMSAEWNEGKAAATDFGPCDM